MAATSVAYAGTKVQIGEQIIVEEGKTVNITSDDTKTEHYNAITKDGEGTAVIVGNVTKYSGIFVREGELQIGDGVTETNLRIEVTDDNDAIYGIGISAAGKDAVVTFNKATYSNGGEIFNQVGGSDGNGTINITNGSKINLTSNSNFLVGNSTYSTSTTTTPDSTDSYEGNYADSENKRGKGIINVSGGSVLNTGYHNFWMSEGELNVDGENTVANICNYYGNRTILGLESGSNSEVNVTNGGTLVFNSETLNTTWGSNVATKINVDGENSLLLRPNERPAHPDNGVKGKTKTDIATKGSNSSTEISVTNGGSVALLSDETNVGAKNNTVTISVDSKSSLQTKKMVVTGNTTITNDGAFYASEVIMNGGTFINNGNMAGDILATTADDLDNAESLLITVGQGAEFVQNGTNALGVSVEGGSLTLAAGSVNGDVQLSDGTIIVTGNSISGNLLLNGGTITFEKDAQLTLSEGASLTISEDTAFVVNVDSVDNVMGMTLELFTNVENTTAMDGAVITLVDENNNAVDVFVSAVENGVKVDNVVPEPTTATLSLLALAALAARRRRK